MSLKDDKPEDLFAKQHDKEMHGMAVSIMQTGTITESQNAKVIGWLILNMLTVKQSMWTNRDFEKAVEKVLTRKAWRWSIILMGIFLILVAILILHLFGVDTSKFIHIHN